MSIQNPKGMEEFQRLQPLKARLEGVARLVRKFCSRKRKAAAKPTFIRILVQFFTEDIADDVNRDANFPTAKTAEQVPLQEFLRTREWLQKAEVTLAGVGEN